MSEQRLEHRFIFALPMGLHARPASMLAEALCPFEVRATLHKEAGGSADLCSVLSVIALDVKHGDACVIEVEGPDAGEALGALLALIEGELGAGDEPVATVSIGPRSLPLSLERLGARMVVGRGVCGGVGTGVCVVAGAQGLSRVQLVAMPRTVAEELADLDAAATRVRGLLKERAGAAASSVERDVLGAHARMAEDPALLSEAARIVRAGDSAARALRAAAEAFAARLAAAESAYIRDRALDVLDVAGQMLAVLPGGAADPGLILHEDSVVFAELLTPNQLLRLNAARLKGLVLGRVGATSHTVILARSLGVPTVLDVPSPATAAPVGEPVMVDGDTGVCITGVTPAVTRYFDRRRAVELRRTTLTAPRLRMPAMTRDGQRVEVGCNASQPEHVESAMRGGAEGVGLLRTEMLFLDREEPPDEDEQAEAYGAAVRAAAGRPVIIRTFDIGGDKPAGYMRMAVEENPFLGVRGARLYARHPAMLRTQLRAILRASILGPVKVMAPMVTLAREAAEFRAQVDRASAQLRTEGVDIDERIAVGVMVEVPALALAMDDLCRHVDFISVGTNDLTQYVFAVDRGNAGVAALYNARSPALLRLLKMIVDGARRNGRWVGVCGEMAGDVLNLPLLIGLDVDEVSVGPRQVTPVKLAVQGLSAQRCRGLTERALAAADAAEVTALLEHASCGGVLDAPLLEERLIELDVDAVTKEEAIRAAVDLLAIHDRTSRADDVERAVWAREETYSTGFGNGFAVPHCKTDAVATPTLALLRLREAVEWGSMDGAPVKVVLLLAIPASAAAAHMQVFAKLARRLMHEEFRASLLSAENAGEILRALVQELGL